MSSSAPGLLDFCSGPVGFQAAIESLTAPSGSTFHLNQDGSFSYFGVPGIGNDTFKYTIFLRNADRNGNGDFYPRRRLMRQMNHPVYPTTYLGLSG